MDNISRSVRSRKAILAATLTIVARDGVRRLTLDAIARESRMSKGGLTYQFNTKEAVLKALLDQYKWSFEDFFRQYLLKNSARSAQPQLAAHIATLCEGSTTPCSIFMALLGAATEEPSLISSTRNGITENLQNVKDESADPEAAIVRWLAAWGLNLITLLGLSPFSKEEREELFRLLSNDQRFAMTSVSTNTSARSA